MGQIQVRLDTQSLCRSSALTSNSDIWGRKPVLLTAATIFFLGSAISGAATSIDMLIAGRAVQGVGGGGLIILVNICISDLFSMRCVAHLKRESNFESTNVTVGNEQRILVRPNRRNKLSSIAYNFTY